MDFLLRLLVAFCDVACLESPGWSDREAAESRLRRHRPEVRLIAGVAGLLYGPEAAARCRRSCSIPPDDVLIAYWLLLRPGPAKTTKFDNRLTELMPHPKAELTKAARCLGIFGPGEHVVWMSESTQEIARARLRRETVMYTEWRTIDGPYTPRWWNGLYTLGGPRRMPVGPKNP